MISLQCLAYVKLIVTLLKHLCKFGIDDEILFEKKNIHFLKFIFELNVI